MTQEEFKQYSELQVKFAHDVNRVTNYLGKIDYDLNHITEFYLENGTVFTHGWEYWSYGGQEEHTGYFDAEMLTWTDEQLQEYVDKKIKERELESIAQAELTKKQEEERERKELERLKAKYGE